MAAVLEGPGAVLRWVYRQAAVLGPWTMTMDATGPTVTAPIEPGADQWAMRQDGLSFVVARPTGPSWKWPVIAIEATPTAVSLRLGPQED